MEYDDEHAGYLHVIVFDAIVFNAFIPILEDVLVHV